MGLCIALLFVMIIMVMPQRVEAAQYSLGNPAVQTENASSETYFGASKIGSKFFYKTWKSSRTVLYAAGSRTGKGKAFHTLKSTDTLTLNMTGRILSDGTFAIYAVSEENKTTGKAVIYIYRTRLSNGRQEKLYTYKVPAADIDVMPELDVCAVYGDALYYQIKNSRTGKVRLYSYSFKKKKSTSLTGKFNFIEGDGHSRYMYGIAGTKASTTVYIFDCKKNKIIKTLKNKNAAYTFCQRDKKLFYEWNHTVYSMDLQGKKSKKVLSLTADQYISLIGYKKIFYISDEVDEKGRSVEKYYTYTLSTKKTKEITDFGEYKNWSDYVASMASKSDIHSYQ